MKPIVYTQITASDIDFFRSGVGYLRHLEYNERYPPSFKVEVNGSAATKSDVLCINFKGATDKLEFQKPLALLHKQLSGNISKALATYTVFLM